jgi:hypothetical protein
MARLHKSGTQFNYLAWVGIKFDMQQRYMERVVTMRGALSMNDTWYKVKLRQVCMTHTRWGYWISIRQRL